MRWDYPQLDSNLVFPGLEYFLISGIIFIIIIIIIFVIIINIIIITIIT